MKTCDLCKRDPRADETSLCEPCGETLRRLVRICNYTVKDAPAHEVLTDALDAKVLAEINAEPVPLITMASKYILSRCKSCRHKILLGDRIAKRPCDGAWVCLECACATT